MELPLERETEGFEKIPSLMGESDANECNESSLSNCRVQLALSTKKDGMILEKRLENVRNQNPFSILLRKISVFRRNAPIDT